jgi:epidermal growth factor receptor substrate 15
VQSALYGPAAARIPAPNIAAGPVPPQMGAARAPRPQGSAAMAPAPGHVGAGQMNQTATPRPQGSGMMPTSNQASSPQVNPGAAPRPQGINSMTPAASQGAAMRATQFAGPRAMHPQPPSTGFNQQHPALSTGFMRPPQMGASATSLQAQIPGSNQSPLGGGSMGQGGNFGSVGGAPQATTGGAAPSQIARSGFGLGLPSTMGMAPGQQAQVMSSSPLPPQSNSVVPPQDAKALVLSANGPAGSSGSSTDIFSALTQPKASASVPPTLLLGWCLEIG